MMRFRYFLQRENNISISAARFSIENARKKQQLMMIIVAVGNGEGEWRS